MVTFVLFALGAWTLGLVLRIDALAYAAYLSLGVWAWSRWYAAGCAPTPAGAAHLPGPRVSR